jgi:hypothetical protein
LSRIPTPHDLQRLVDQPVQFDTGADVEVPEPGKELGEIGDGGGAGCGGGNSVGSGETNSWINSSPIYWSGVPLSPCSRRQHSTRGHSASSVIPGVETIGA